MSETIFVERRFCGPPDSGNGGYVSGRLAALIDGPALVRLQVPPPLEVELSVKKTAGGVELLHGATVVAWARPSEVSIQVPSAPGFAEAEAASRSYRGFKSHPFPTCLVCGPERAEGDGLRIFPGPLGRDGIVACPWVPAASFADNGGTVRPEFMWAALDCPGGFSFEMTQGDAVLLGELAADVRGRVRVGERCVAIGWELGREGRKHHVGSALFSASGECRGVARATWFEITRSAAR